MNRYAFILLHLLNESLTIHIDLVRRPHWRRKPTGREQKKLLKRNISKGVTRPVHLSLFPKNEAKMSSKENIINQMP